MRQSVRTMLASLSMLLLSAAWPLRAQTSDAAIASLREVRVEGQKHLSDAQIAALTGLVVGSQVGRTDLQAAADKLVQTGLFAKVSYNFETRTGVVVTRSEEHTSELQSRSDLVCRLLLE